MGRRKDHRATKSQTLPSSPTHSSSSSDFEFTVAFSPRGGGGGGANSSSYSSSAAAALCPADELFYKGQLLPLHLSPRLSMVRTLLLASSSTSSSSDTTTTASRDSTGSSSNDSRSSFSAADLLLLPPSDCDSSRPSSAAAEETDFAAAKKTSKYFSLSRFSSVFRGKPRHPTGSGSGPAPSPVKRLSKTAREVIGKYLKKVKPLYEKLSQNQKPQHKPKPPPEAVPNSPKETAIISHSFSGNLRYPRRTRRSCVSSCPSSMRSSPSHSGVLCRPGFTPPPPVTKTSYPSDMSSMEELQNAIQGAIAHCKNSMLQPSTTTTTSSNKNKVVSNEI